MGKLATKQFDLRKATFHTAVNGHPPEISALAQAVISASEHASALPADFHTKQVG